MLSTIAAAALSVLFVGDSITSWPESYADQSAFDSINIGVPGSTVPFWLQHFEALAGEFVNCRNPDGSTCLDAASILLGTNDSGHRSTAIEYSIRARVLLSRFPADLPVVVSTPPRILAGHADAETFNELIAGYDFALRHLAAELPNVFYGIDWRVIGCPDSSYADTVHPDRACHELAQPLLDARITAAVGVPVPEPATGLLLALGVAGLAARRRCPAFRRGRR